MKDIKDLFTAITVPVCQIQEWEVVDFTSETELPATSEIAQRTFQVGPFNKASPLKFNNTLTSQE